MSARVFWVMAISTLRSPHREDYIPCFDDDGKLNWLDRNNDGVLTRVEWPDERFSRVDFNHDGVLSAYEYGVGR